MEFQSFLVGKTKSKNMTVLWNRERKGHFRTEQIYSLNVDYKLSRTLMFISIAAISKGITSFVQ